MKKILVIDDDPEMLRQLRALIKERTQYVPLITNNPFEGIEMAKGGGFEVIITDLKMPECDGLQVLAAIKEQEPDLPVIVMDGFPSVERGVEILRKGGFEYIPKPCRKEQILFAIERAHQFRLLRKENARLNKMLRFGNEQQLSY
jgi:DNA-binding NtrC family response regulator